VGRRSVLPRGRYEGRWLVAFGVALYALACGGKSASVTNDAGSVDATAIAAEAGQAARLDANAGLPQLDGTVHQMNDGSLDAAFGSESGQPTQSDANAPALDAMPLGDAIPPVVCDPSKCASGCCGATGCLPGTTSTACGFGGQSCTDCTGLGLACVSPMAGESGGVCGVLDAGTTTDGAPACGPANCLGCCAGSVCVAGTTNASCGSHGLACQQCTAANVTCMPQGPAGACVGTGAHCSPSNCVGCCDSNGSCEDPAAIGACGAGGGLCQFCLPGQACNSGQCQTTSGCGPANCLGCCQGSTCLSGSIDESACGSGGAQCQSCPVCLPLGPKNGGVCLKGSRGCDDAICATGCCDEFDRCLPGNTDNYCIGPNRGQGCGTCGGTCATGACIGGMFCNGSSCGSGACCMPDGTCWTGGADDAHCGRSLGGAGALCFNCGPGYVCDTSNNTPFPTCTIACSPQNCKGCCVGGVCSTGTDPTSCGSGGNVCAQCAQGQSCLNGACITLSQCGPTLCAGCCQNDVCLVGFDSAACGTGGGPCANCSDAGHACVGATCTQ
jgi:hypothetical protein